MNKSVSYYISELLFLHDCVIIPDFGGFVANRKSAQLSKTTGTLTPPSKKILFNPNLKTNDGLLISHIANNEGVNQEIAKKYVKLFLNESNTKLNNFKVLRIEKIGLFTVGKEGNIFFLQDSIKNYSLDSFGMKPTHSKLIKRNTQARKEVEATVQKIRTTSRNPKAVLRAAAVIIPLVALSYLSISQQERINNVYIQMATFNPFPANEKTDGVTVSLPEKKLETESINTPKTEFIEKILINDIAEEKAIPIIISQKTYYIIGGAFAEKKNANKMLKKLNNRNYNAEIIKEGLLSRVSYDSFNNRVDAVLALNKIKKENPNAWLLTK